MHWRNESGLFKPQPHAVWFSIVIMVVNLCISIGFQVLQILPNIMSNG